MTYTRKIALGFAAAVAALALAACGTSATHNTTPAAQAPAATAKPAPAYGTRTQFVTIAQSVQKSLQALNGQPLATEMTGAAAALQAGAAKFKAVTWPPAAQFMVTVVENDMAAGARAAVNFDVSLAAQVNQRLTGDLQAVARNAGWAPFTTN